MKFGSKLLLLWTVFAGCASMNEFSHDVPDNAHPDLSDLYELISDGMNTGQMPQKANGQKRELLYTLLDCARFPSSQELGNMPGDNESVARDRLAERYKKDDPYEGIRPRDQLETLCTDLVALDVIPKDGINHRERRLLKAFLTKAHPGEAYRSYENQVFETALADLRQSDELREAFDSWKKQKDYTDAADAAAQYRLKQKTLQYIADKIRDAYGLEPIPVHLAVFPRHLEVAGFHDPYKHQIAVNYNAYWGATDDPQNAVETLIEETRHSVDADFVTLLKNRDISPDDPRAPHAAIIRVNQLLYVYPYKMSETDNLSRLEQQEIREQYRNYEHQYLERSAKQFSAELRHKLFSQETAPLNFAESRRLSQQ